MKLLLVSVFFFGSIAKGGKLTTSAQEHIARTVGSALIAGLVFVQQPVVADGSRVVGDHFSVGALFGEGPTIAGGPFFDVNYRAGYDLSNFSMRAHLLGMRGGFDSLLFLDATNVAHKNHEDKVSPLWFFRLMHWGHDQGFDRQEEHWQEHQQIGLVNRGFGQAGFGGGLEFVDDLLSRGRYVKVQLRTGVGGIVQYENLFYPDIESNYTFYYPEPPASRATRERARLADLQLITSYSRPEMDKRKEDFDLVGLLELTIKIDKVTVGDLIDADHRSRWHYLPILPHSEITAAVYRELVDGDEMDGNISQLLTGKIQVINNSYLNFEYIDSPYFYQPHQRVSLRLEYIIPE